MHALAKGLLLRVLRVPAEPHAPAGSPGSVRVFRAGRNYYRYHVVLWALRQAAAFVGVFIVVSFPKPWDGLTPPPRLAEVVHQFRLSLANFAEMKQRADRDETHEAANPSAAETPPVSAGERRKQRRWVDAETGGKLEPMWRVMGAIFPVIEALGVAFLLAQLPFTFMLVRLDYEMRWYIITDRSLRIREGLKQVREMTLTFANIQNVSIEQGPVERLLGLSNLKVRSAGGGSGGGGHSKEHGNDDSLHVAYFRGVDNPEEIRDAILGHLRRLRDAGLGDPDERAPAARPEAGPAVAAAKMLLEEVRALRRAATQE